ncbi:MAG: aryl-sulfate sulfotransferase [Anaerolineae bacterium]|nr:aryl-sulfate sulfotransferase [Anaerolineae bacterium]
MGGAEQSYLLIVDDLGQPIYFQPTDVVNPGADFKKQPDGTLTWFDMSTGLHRAMDQSYQVTNTWATSGFPTTDMHELQVMTNGTALMMSYNIVPVDLSAHGGMTNAIVWDIVVQEQDELKNPVFTWSGLDHLPITTTYESLTGSIADVYHGNAIERDTDGNLLLSNRHTAQIVKINRATGNVMWKLGGKENEFTFVNDTGFSYQHDIRRLENGHITLFDNGNPHEGFPAQRSIRAQWSMKSMKSPRSLPGSGNTGATPIFTDSSWATSSVCPTETPSLAGAARPRSDQR